ncbi:MAG: Gfo/Idh/MocA family oxidoreductase [Lachnospiraceae bacterium]|nr:Gfo/Idh/MocA family oxidoreductase [Lachnospiraceae bacterium]
MPEYVDNPDVCLYGLFDINKERAQELSQKYNCKAYGIYEELLADPDIDAVSVCVANNAHAQISIAAMKAGKHVLCEKPMAVTLEECEAMVKTAKETGRYLMIGQNQRLAKAHVKAKQLIAEGAIGKVLTFRTIFGHGGPETWSVDPGKNTWFFDKKKAAMGAMADLGIHKTDLIQYITGQKVVETKAVLTTLDKRYGNGELIGVDDNAICIYTLEGGAIGTMTASWTYYAAEDNTTVIYGTKGMLRLYDDPVYSVQLFTAEGEKVLYEIDQIQTNDNQTKSGIIDLFVESLVEQKEPEISGESVLSAMRAVFGSIESSETGKAVRVNS